MTRKSSFDNSSPSQITSSVLIISLSVSCGRLGVICKDVLGEASRPLLLFLPASQPGRREKRERSVLSLFTPKILQTCESSGCTGSSTSSLVELKANPQNWVQPAILKRSLISNSKTLPFHLQSPKEARGTPLVAGGTLRAQGDTLSGQGDPQDTQEISLWAKGTSF